MMRKVLIGKALEDLIPEQQEVTIPHNMHIPAQGGGDLWTGADVCRAFDRYGGMLCWCREEQGVQDYALFYNVWRWYIVTRLEDIQRLYDALYSQYNPISNYDMTETEHKGTKVDEATTTVTPSGKSTVTETASKTGFNSSTFEDTDKAVSETEYEDYNTETVTQLDNTLTNTELDDSYHALDDRKLTRSGNIGVTTSQQMIESEWALRSRVLLYSIIDDFIRTWTYAVRGVY